MSTSDRKCPSCGDVGALPQSMHCHICGAGLVMKGGASGVAGAVVHGLAIGFGAGAGSELGHAGVRALTGAGDHQPTAHQHVTAAMPDAAGLCADTNVHEALTDSVGDLADGLPDVSDFFS